MKRIYKLSVGAFSVWVSLCLLSLPVLAKDVPRITKEELKGLLGSPDLVIFDVRTGSSWDESTQKIQGAVREDPENVKAWVNKYAPDKTLVFYCT